MKDIRGFEGLYAVTSCGRVWSYRRKKFLKPHTYSNGYLYVDLSKNGKHNLRRVHRLVAEAYIPNPDNLPQVNHKDEIKTHNWINNLEWCDAKYNVNYGTGIDRSTKKRSMKIRCVETGEEFASMMDCMRKTGISQGNISMHLRGIKYKSILGLHFERVDYL